MKFNKEDSLIGMHFVYMSGYDKNPKFDKIIKLVKPVGLTIQEFINKAYYPIDSYVISQNGIRYEMREIKLTPISEIRKNRLKKLGIK